MEAALSPAVLLSGASMLGSYSSSTYLVVLVASAWSTTMLRPAVELLREASSTLL
jgi:hypothetical protein